MGICIKCRKSPKCRRLVRCRMCTLKDLAYKHLGDSKRWSELADRLIQQDYQCHYTGKRIDIGNNASIEHLVPKHLKRSNETFISNIRWVHNDINLMKNKLSITTFLQRCKEVLSHLGYKVVR